MADVKRPVVVLDIDGLKRELFYNMLADGRLPGFERLVGRGAWVRHGVTVIPSETLPAQTSLFTGLLVKNHGIVSNGWLERDAKPPFMIDFTRADAAAMVYGYRLVGLPTLLLPDSDTDGLVNLAMAPGALTMYERASRAGLRSIVVFSQISRGASVWVRPSRPDMVYFALSTRAKLDYARMDRKTWGTIKKTLKEHGLPDLLTLYFCGLDAWGHHTEDLGQDVYLEQTLDPIMDELARLFEARGWLDRTRFALCSDHGHSWLDRRLRIGHDALARALAGCGRTAAAHAPLPAKADAYLNIIGGCAHVHLRRRGTADWSEPPDLEADLLPAARALAALGADSAKTPPAGPPGALFSLILVRPAPGQEYCVFHDNKLIPLEKYFWNRLGQTPNAFQNIYGLNCGRSGDIVLFSDFVRGCYFADEDVPRSHGSLAPDDMGIPIIFSGPGIPHRIIDQASIVDIAPTILSLLGVDFSGCDGRALAVSDSPGALR